MLRTLLLATLLTGFAGFVQGQERQPVTTLIRNYDIRWMIPNDPPLETPAFLRQIDGDAIDLWNRKNVEDQASPDELITQVVTLIQGTVGAQDQWAAYGGELASVREINHQLIIRQTPENHEEIKKLLGSLRARPGEAKAYGVTLRGRVIDLPADVADAALLEAHRAAVRGGTPATLDTLVAGLEAAGGTAGPTASLTVLSGHRGQAVVTAEEGRTGLSFVARPAPRGDAVVVDLRIAMRQGPAGGETDSVWATTARVLNRGAVVLSANAGTGQGVRALVLHVDARPLD
jgi:hypothetical protein